MSADANNSFNWLRRAKGSHNPPIDSNSPIESDKPYKVICRLVKKIDFILQVRKKCVTLPN